MGLRRVYIVIPTPAIGGAEKRLVGLWRHLQRTGYRGVRLVIRRQLWELLQQVAELAPLPLEHVELFDDEGVDGWARPLRRLLRELHRRDPTAVFHYVMVSPAQVQRFFSTRTLFTLPASSLGQFNLAGRAAVLSAVLMSRRTDVLDEGVLEALGRQLPFRREALSATPSSFVDLDYFRPAERKEPMLVFIGLFSEEKQAYRLARAIPVIDAELKAKGIPDARFRLLGRETQRLGVAEICAAATGVDVRAWFEPDPASVLASARVVFSLQKQTNYPSKALLEGMACGCLPVVTDVGTTRRIARDDFAYFVPRDFTPVEIAQACVRALSVEREDHARKVATMRTLLRERFSIEAMADYYLGLYAQLSGP